MNPHGFRATNTVKMLTSSGFGPGLAAGRRWVLRALTSLVVVLTLWSTPVAAQSPDDCSVPVIDTSGSVDVARVEEAILTVDPAATVVVRSFEEVPDADLVAAIDEIVIECFSSDDGVRADVIVLGLSIRDGLSDVLIGGRWSGVITDPDRLRTETMGEPFAAADYTGGLVAAINQIADEIAADGGSAPATAPDQDRPAPAAPGGGRSPWSIAGGLAGLAACGGALYGVSRRRRLSADREDLDRYLAAPRARLGALRGRHAHLASENDLWTMTTAGTTRAELSERYLAAEQAQAEANRQSGMLAEILPDGAAKAGRVEIQRGRERVIELSKALDLHDDALDRLAAFGAHLDHLRITVPAKLDLLDEEIDEALELAATREGEGFSVDVQRAELDAIDTEIRDLDTAADGLELDLLELSDRAEQAEARLFAVDHYLQSLPSRLASLRKWNQELDAAADLELKRIDDLRRQFLSVTAHHASDSWRWAADHPELAVDELDRADALQAEAITGLVAEQRFDEAGRQLDRAGLHLIRADELLDQVDDLIVDLDHALRDAPGIVAEAREIHSELSRYLGANQADLDAELVARRDRFAAAIDGLENELRQIKPNHLRVAETGRRLNDEMDAALVEAAEQKARADALRRALAREIADANRALSRAKRSLGWELIRSSDGVALEQLDARLDSLAAEPAVSELDTAIAAATEIADQALRIQERIIARRRRRGTWITTGGGGWVGGGGGWSPPSTPRRRRGPARSGRARSGGGRSFGGGRSRSGGGRSFGSGRSPRRSSGSF